MEGQRLLGYTAKRLNVLINRLRDKRRWANFPEPVLMTHRQKGYQKELSVCGGDSGGEVKKRLVFSRQTFSA